MAAPSSCSPAPTAAALRSPRVARLADSAVHVLAVGLLATALASAGRGQCTPQWLPGDGLPGVRGDVHELVAWDPDGAGPFGAHVAIAGAFDLAGNANAHHVALYDPATRAWSPFGSGMNGDCVLALAVLPNGDLVAAGDFTLAGGVPANNIARWNGAAWSPLGGGFAGGAVRDLLVLPNGDLIAGGDFVAASGAPAAGLARWNGTAWSAIGGGVSGGGVVALAVLANGDLVVGGEFAAAGGVQAGGLAIWNGSAWSAPGGAVRNGDGIYSLAVLPNGDLVVGGFYWSIGGVPARNIARWDGAIWAPLGSGLVASAIESPFPGVFALLVAANGDLVAGGCFHSGGAPALWNIARWDGSAWSDVGGSVGELDYSCVRSLVVLPGGDLHAGGRFPSAGRVQVAGMACCSQGAWSAPGSGLTGTVAAIVALPDGRLVARGPRLGVGGSSWGNGLAQWDGSAWSPLGVGFCESAQAIATTSGGDLLAAGSFATGGGIVEGIARWDGGAWAMVATGVTGEVEALVELQNGDLVVGGSFDQVNGVVAWNIARWDGSSWSQLGGGLPGPYGWGAVRALAVLPNGDLVAGGSFAVAGGVGANNIARWDGTAWSAMGSGITGEVQSLAVLPAGGLVVGGRFHAAGGVLADNIARWSGGAWSTLGSGLQGTPLAPASVSALAVLPNGDVVAGGAFLSAGALAVASMARWNGAAWSAIGGGTDGRVHAIVLQANGTIAIGGDFARADGLASACFARCASPCPAFAAPDGAACASSGGANAFVATSLPWTGSVFRARGIGLPAHAFVATVTGLTAANVPLGAILGLSPAGCRLLVTPDVVTAEWIANGTATTALAVPNVPALAGTQVRQQLVALEVDANLTFVQNTSSNALVLTIGTF